MPPELQISEDGLTRTLALIESEGKLALAMALIDPGANVVIASTELAETLKLRETGTGEMGTAAGPHTATGIENASIFIRADNAEHEVNTFLNHQATPPRWPRATPTRCFRSETDVLSIFVGAHLSANAEDFTKG